MEAASFSATTSPRRLSFALVVSAIGHGVAMAAFVPNKPPMGVPDRAMVVSLALAPPHEAAEVSHATHASRSPRTASPSAPPAPREPASIDGAATDKPTRGGGDAADAASPGEVAPVGGALPPVAARFDAAYLANPRPAYPAASRAFGEQGTVFLLVQVSAQGEAEAVTLHASSGYPRLDRAALDAVRGWRFVPARRGDSPIAASVIVPVAFILRQSS